MITRTYDETRWQLVPKEAAYRSRLAAVIPLQEFATMLANANMPRYAVYRGDELVWQAPAPKAAAISEDAARTLAAKLWELMRAAAPDDHRNDEQVGAGDPLNHTCATDDQLFCVAAGKNGGMVQFYAFTDAQAREIMTALMVSEAFTSGVIYNPASIGGAVLATVTP